VTAAPVDIWETLWFEDSRSGLVVHVENAPHLKQQWIDHHMNRYPLRFHWVEASITEYVVCPRCLFHVLDLQWSVP